MKESEILAFLKHTPLFADLNDTALAAIARVSRARQIPKGCVIFNQGDEADGAYIVRSGCVAVTLNTLDGRELVINEMRPGDLLGEVALITHSTRSATATATVASEVLVIPCVEFLAKIDDHPALMKRLVETLAQRLRSSTERESALAFEDAPARLASMLLKLDYENRALGYMIISQEELAQHIGITRQTAAKILGKWRRAGWIITGRGRIVVLDRVALRRCALQANSDGAG